MSRSATVAPAASPGTDHTAAAERLVALTVGRPARCSGRLRRSRGVACPSLLALVQPGLERHDRGDGSALAPGPLTDRVFTRLVRQVVADLDPRPPTATARTRSAGHWQVTRLACDLIDNNPDLAWRAAELRRAAAAAEGAMELHFSRLLATVAARWPSVVSPGPPPPPGSPEALTRLRQALDLFPYTRNYELLVQAEVAGLPHGQPTGDLTFYGAGPLPLTGVFWHHLTGAGVTLVDIDPEAAEAARLLLDALAGLGALDGDAFEVVVADAGHHEPGPGVVLAASLLPTATVHRLTTRWAAATRSASSRYADRSSDPLLVRSATGLVARLVYDRVEVEPLARLGAVHRGTVAPWSMVNCGTSVPADIGIDADFPVPIRRAPHGVLNITEILTLPPAQSLPTPPSREEV